MNKIGLKVELEPLTILRVHLAPVAQHSIDPGIDLETSRLQATIAVPIGTVQKQHIDESNSFSNVFKRPIEAWM